jgi:predicted outer membrane protein
MKKTSTLGILAFLTLGGCSTTAEAPLPEMTAAYQLINFDLKECSVLRSRPPGPQVAVVSAKICADTAHFQPLVEQLAAKRGITLPNDPSYDLAAQYVALSYRPWPSIDVNYLQDQIGSHAQALAVFQQAAQQTTDLDLKFLAEGAIPVVQDNLGRLRQALAEIGGA